MKSPTLYLPGFSHQLQGSGTRSAARRLLARAERLDGLAALVAKFMPATLFAPSEKQRQRVYTPWATFIAFLGHPRRAGALRSVGARRAGRPRGLPRRPGGCLGGDTAKNRHANSSRDQRKAGTRARQPLRAGNLQRHRAAPMNRDFFTSSTGQVVLVVAVLALGIFAVRWQNARRTPAPLPAVKSAPSVVLPRTLTREGARFRRSSWLRCWQEGGGTKATSSGRHPGSDPARQSPPGQRAGS